MEKYLQRALEARGLLITATSGPKQSVLVSLVITQTVLQDTSTLNYLVMNSNKHMQTQQKMFTLTEPKTVGSC